MVRWSLRRLKPAADAVADAVRHRARELGIRRPVVVYRDPKDWSYWNGRAVDGWRRSYVILSSETQYLLLDTSKGDRGAQFYAIVDHELGHVSNRDASLLYLARAMRWSNGFGLVLKGLLIYFITSTFQSGQALQFYDGLVPRSNRMEMVGMSGSLARDSSPSFSARTLVAVVGAYTVCLLLLAEGFYRVVTRRREFLADAFAIENARNRARAVDSLRELLRQAPRRAAHPHSLLGRLHPTSEQRLDAIAGAGNSERWGNHRGITVFLFLSLLISFRFTLGNSGLVQDYSAPIGPLVALSAFFIFLCGYCVSCVVHPEHSSGWVGSYAALKQLVIASSGIAALLWILQRLAQPFRNAYADLPDGGQVGAAYQSLLDIESNEVAWMFLSIPLVAIAFAGASVAVRSAGSLIGRCRRVTIGSVLITCAVALVGLWLASAIGGASVRGGRQEGLAGHRLSGGKTDEDYRDDPTPLIKGDLQQISLDFEAGIAAARFANPKFDFNPPLAVLLLWKGPFRSGF